jgi:hypothetical protein
MFKKRKNTGVLRSMMMSEKTLNGKNNIDKQCLSLGKINQSVPPAVAGG